MSNPRPPQIDRGLEPLSSALRRLRDDLSDALWEGRDADARRAQIELDAAKAAERNGERWLIHF